MSEELDTVLRPFVKSLLNDNEHCDESDDIIDSTVTIIKNMFADAGYVDTRLLGEDGKQAVITASRKEAYKAVDKYLDNGGALPLIVTVQEQYERTLADNGYMKGQEWYDKLMQELNIPQHLGNVKNTDDMRMKFEQWIKGCAKRASGLPIEETK